MANSTIKKDGFVLEVLNTTSPYTLTHGFNELLIYLGHSNTQKIPLHIISSDNMTYYGGYNGTGVTFGAAVEINGNKLIPTVIVNGNTATPYMTIYYK